MKTAYMHKIHMGTIGDMKNLEHQYTEMAEKGWMIDKIGVLTHRYRAVEPCKKRFFVDFLPQITMFDYPENEDAQSYRRICEESGWNFVAANKQFHVFCSDDDNDAPIPIHTDNRIHAKIYLKACMKYELPLLLYAVIMFCFSSPLGKGAEIFLSDLSLFMTIGCCCFIIGFIWTLGFMISWCIRTRESAKNDLPLPVVDRRLAKLRNRVFAVGAMALLLCLITGVVLEIIGGMPIIIGLIGLIPLSAVGVGFWIRRQIDTKRRTRGGNIGLTVAALIITEIVLIGVTVYAVASIQFTPNSDSPGDRPALTLSDVGVTAEPNYSGTRVEGTIAVPVNYNHWESGGGGNTDTHIYCAINKTLARWLYEHFTEQLYKQFSYRFDDYDYLHESFVALSSDEAAYWGASSGVAYNYANSDTVELLLLKDKTILRITAESMNMDSETIRQAVLKLWDE